MNFIVLDLEWNQSPIGKSGEKKELPFEIIEIGAVRFDSERCLQDRFQETIHPQIYKSLHFKTREVISLDQEDLITSRDFPDVCEDFLKWCGPDPVFCTWGPADLTELQRNMEFYRIPYKFPFPLFYYDIQKIFSIVYEDKKSRRSLEYAVDFLNIEKEMPFHNALGDAFYTASVMKYLPAEKLLSYSSIDCHQTPLRRKQEIYVEYDTYTKFISKPFDSKPAALKDRIVSSTTCYRCNKKTPKKIRWFSVGSSNYFCLSQCPEHGYLKGKIRLRQNANGKFYAVKTQKLIGEEEALAIRERKEIQTIKRRLKSKFQTSI